MNETPYSNREIDAMHQGTNDKLDLILKQTTKTNGKVTSLEKFMWTMGGAMFIFGMLEFDKIIQLFS